MIRTIVIALSLATMGLETLAADDDFSFVSITKRATEKNTIQFSSILTEGDLLQASNRHAPLILASIQDAKGAQGRALSALGAFDVNLSANGFARATGFWNGRVINTEARQYIGDFGAQIYGGYRISDGEFPIYEDVNFTNTLGEAKIGTLFSLLRNRDIDANRFTRRDSALALQQSELDILLTRVSVQRQALLAYWRWVALGRQLAIYDELLTIALERQKAIDIQIEEGAIADIFRLENQQNITHRQTLKTQAEQRLRAAANQLGFYLRDDDGQRRQPADNELPEKLNTKAMPILNTDINYSSILSERPELRQLRIGIERAERKIALAKNDLKPDLDFRLELSHDFGNVAEGGISRDSTDTIVGFNFRIPIGQRAAKGKLQEARAKRGAFDHQKRALEDQISIEIENILVDLEAAQRLLALAQVDVKQTEGMAIAEKKRFENGASDFFLLNVREENAANAKIREYVAYLQLKTAEANFAAATMNTERLGINADY